MTCASTSLSLSRSLSPLPLLKSTNGGSQDMNPRNQRLAESYPFWPARAVFQSPPESPDWLISPRKNSPWRTDPPPPP